MKIDTSKTYQLADLNGWDPELLGYAALGHPIDHSLSPTIHNAAFKDNAHFDNCYKSAHYIKIEVHPNDLVDALSLLHQLRFQGLNLTAPLKQLALSLAGELEPLAEKIGAINTLKWTPTGYKGFNTDVTGLVAAIDRHFYPNWEDLEVIIIGCGGAGRAALFAMFEHNVRHIYVGNRTFINLYSFYDSLPEHLQNKMTPFDLKEDIVWNSGPYLIINATPMGMQENDPTPFDMSRVETFKYVYDMVYKPNETRWVKECQELGIPAFDGKSLLVEQAAVSFTVWTNQPAPSRVMYRALSRELKLKL